MKIKKRYYGLILFFACISVFGYASTKAALNLSISNRIEKGIDRGYFQIKLPPLRYSFSTNYNVVFLEDDSFTVGDRLGLPKIYEDDKGRGRYGYIGSGMIESPRYFKGIKAEIKKTRSEHENMSVDIQARDELGNYTEWLRIDENRDNTVFFYQDFRFKYLSYRVIFVTGDPHDAPVVKSVSLWGIE